MPDHNPYACAECFRRVVLYGESYYDPKTGEHFDNWVCRPDGAYTLLMDVALKDLPAVDLLREATKDLAPYTLRA